MLCATLFLERGGEMKIGIRTPSIKRMVKARTVGKLKRAVKKAVDPTYGKQGIGLLKDPKKAVYNKVYSKVTINPFKLFAKLFK